MYDKYGFDIGKYEFSFGKSQINRKSIINHLIHKYNLKSYLEIGVRNGGSFNHIMLSNKIGVDPAPRLGIKEIEKIYKMTSDLFFQNLHKNRKFDIIFIDGDHSEKQVAKDIQNSLKCLSNNGFIICHDMSPPTKWHQRSMENWDGLSCNGDGWKAWVKLRMTTINLKMYVVNTDWGVGVIQKGTQELYSSKENIAYEDLENDRKKILNLVTTKEFLTN